VSSGGLTANTTSYTFTSQNIGTADASRRVVIALAARDTSAQPTSVTVGGTSLTSHASRTSTHVVSIWSAVIATGSTANVVVTFASANTFCGIGVWALYGKSYTGNSANGGNSSGNITMNLTTTSGDFCIGIVAYAVAASVPTGSITWSAATERYDAEVDGRFRNHSGADLIASGSSANFNLTIASPDAATAGAGAGVCAGFS
jgi:hypothetical protein